MIYSLDLPIQKIKRVPPAYQKRLLKLGPKTVRDLFYHFPHRYDDFSNIVPIGQLKLNEVATIQGQITEIKNTRSWRKKIYITEALVNDRTGSVRAVWFNQPFIADTLKENSFVSLSGKVNFDKALYFSNPAYEKINSPSPRFRESEAGQPSFSKEGEPPLSRGGAGGILRHTGRLIPVYPETAGLSSRYLRYLLQIILPSIQQIKDWLPEETKKAQNLLNLNSALKQIHFPDSAASIQQARRRLAFDELFLIQLFVLQQKIKWQKECSLQIKFDEGLIKSFVAGLPFRLTDAQRKAAWEILQDLNKKRPMNRLLEGDVGSGKTVVAAIAALQAMSASWQTAIMAPTEILAKQHWQELTKLLKDYNFKIGLLTNSESKFSHQGKTEILTKKEFVAAIKNGQLPIVIGTHALIQEKVSFKKLALVILDEQHRFGVEQRAALQKNVLQMEDGSKTTIPHLLSMTATPIPRTLTLTIYGDLDISILDELPRGRQKIITEIISPANRQKIYEFIRLEIKKGRQAFVICPRIEAEENHETPGQNIFQNLTLSDMKAVKEEYEKLSKKVFPEFKIVMLHGRMKAKEKEKIMRDFKDAQTDILVSTSVVEVGIDVPNATAMMIEGAERFGLAQLHQFRGRVGRGRHQSYCFLLTESPSAKTNARLKAMLTAKNGFELAEKDLAIRGPGEFFGTKQSGLPDLSMASLADINLIKQVRLEAVKILQKDPALKTYPALGEKLTSFQKTIHLE